MVWGLGSSGLGFTVHLVVHLLRSLGLREQGSEQSCCRSIWWFYQNRGTPL